MPDYDDTLEEIFDQAISIEDPTERDFFIHQACAADQALLDRVKALLVAHHNTDDLLEPAYAETDVPLFSPASERLGTQIGPYKLLQQIGEGGFGVVYMAEQEKPFLRKVALKIVKPLGRVDAQGMSLRATVRADNADTSAGLVMRFDPDTTSGYVFALDAPFDQFFFGVAGGCCGLNPIRFFSVPGSPVRAGED